MLTKEQCSAHYLWHCFPIITIRRISIEEHRHAQLLRQPLAKRPGDIHTLLYADILDGDERTYIQGPHSGMFPTVLCHVDEGKNCLSRI
jgi:hypothetical protein